ncbi:fumarylacetoacetate hydrolase [Subtercola boreus]|uniref:Fumarylacetoacetate hydrolase n=1 Tax=Subtercola boreus TaxID=120213 RepID=A0A3E0VLE8_9MICO|nr:fumarylacetoacetate hydrolase family protein [Subtercola boreus]RFA10250.1 fumarylacetoacetate hydrolase [Subtercola boreus]TQL52571.1 2-keto-4-pentenoate hydratase/2-oxohepta-3-ene-1,7-dioic acid hydratase in catechol pathway [Subtercola boreus]
MRVVGAKTPDGVVVGVLSEDGSEVTAFACTSQFWASPDEFLAAGPTGTTYPLAEVTLVPPVLGSARVLCVGLNYLDHVKEGSFKDESLPEVPTLFARWPQSLSSDGAEVPIPSGEDGLDWEGEVVAWVGSRLVDATPEEALAAVVGYSTFNDITSRRAQKQTSQWIMGKNGDRSGPLGPMVPAAEVGDLRDGLTVETRVNGTVVQRSSTAQMIYGVGETLAHISRSFTLNPGDLLATGTPSGVGYSRTPPWLLQPGDVVEVEVERLGILTSHIVDNSHRLNATSA